MSTQDDSPEAGPSSPPSSPAPATSISALFPPLYLPPPPPTAAPDLPPYTDQGCFAFCAQSSSRRSSEQDPLCRMFCLKVNPNMPMSARSAGKQREDRRWAVRRWIDEREVVYFKGCLSDLKKVQAGEELEELKKRTKKLKRDGEMVVDRQTLKDSGLLVHIPLPIIIFSPFTNFRDRVTFLTAPFTRLLNTYATSFQDGTQSKIAALVWERARSGEVMGFSQKFGKRVLGVWLKKSGLQAEPTDEENRRGRGGGSGVNGDGKGDD